MVLILLIFKTREGRPIKIDNNTIAGAKFSKCKNSCFYSSLYDMRLKEPKIEGRFNLVSCRCKIKSSIADAVAKGGQVVL
jgi:molybdopterin-containing oxidoreductase family iron-sulfur binding subunit